MFLRLRTLCRSGPEVTAEDDQVVLIAGVLVPMVLRGKQRQPA